MMPLPWCGRKAVTSDIKPIDVPVNAELVKFASTVFSAGIVIWAVPSATLTAASATVAVAVGLLAARFVRSVAPGNKLTDFWPLDAVVILSASISAARFAGLTIGIVPYTAAYLISEVLTSIIIGDC